MSGLKKHWKYSSAHFAAVTLAAGVPQTSTAEDVYSHGKATATLQITNGATGPTVQATIQTQIKIGDGPWTAAGSALAGGTTNDAVTQSVVDIPESATQVRFVASGNTDEDVTVDVYLGQNVEAI